MNPLDTFFDEGVFIFLTLICIASLLLLFFFPSFLFLFTSLLFGILSGLWLVNEYERIAKFKATPLKDL